MITDPPIQKCFICNPDGALVFHRGEGGLALSGLGPLVDGYSVVGALQHADSLEDLSGTVVSAYLRYTEELRRRLSDEFGGCLVAEHGNSPLCDFDISRDKHCFHPHFLLFPGASDVTEVAAKKVPIFEKYDSLSSAIDSAASKREYLLLSPQPDEVTVFYPESMLPSQFARSLVASDLGEPSKTNWREHPDWEQARKNAERCRQIVADLVTK